MKGLFIYINTYTSKKLYDDTLMSEMKVDKINFLNIQNEKIVQVLFAKKSTDRDSP